MCWSSQQNKRPSSPADFIINREAREIIELVASVCPSVRPYVCLSVSARLCRVQQRARESHNQSEEFVCVSNNRADAVDLLLFFS